MDYKLVAKQLLERVGGSDNVLDVVHCMTRLRFTLKDESLVDDKLVKSTKGVIDTMNKSGQYQVIIGNEVAKVYKEICEQSNFKKDLNKAPKKSDDKNGVVAKVLDVISGCMAPVIPALIGAAMIKVLLTVLPMMGLLSSESQTYQLISIIGDGAFFFMPVLIAMSAANKFNTNPYYAVSLALIILHPNFIDMMDIAKESGEAIKFFGMIPVTYAFYPYSVIPIILAVWVLSYIEPLVDKITPTVTKNFLNPLLVMLFTAPIVMVVVGPAGAIVGEVLSNVIYFAHDKLGFIAIGLLAGVYPFIVMAGMHHALTPIKLSMIATHGFEAFTCISEICSNMAQGASALAVSIKSKNKDLKQTAGSSAFSALVAGITEPALYGVTVRLKKPMLGACIGAATGGLVGGFFQMKAFGVATPALVTIPQYIEPGNPSSILYVLITIAVTIAVSFVATYIIGFEDIVDEEEVENKEINKSLNTTMKIDSPIEGEVVELSKVNDKTFSQGILGQGVAIIPTKGEVIAPFDGTVEVFFETHHAMGLRSNDGVEVLIHVGLETVNLGGRHFTPNKKAGDIVKKGDLLLTFDIEKIKEEGYDIITPVIISNSDDYMEVIKTNDERASQLQTILTVV